MFFFVGGGNGDSDRAQESYSTAPVNCHLSYNIGFCHTTEHNSNGELIKGIEYVHVCNTCGWIKVCISVQ